jgi:hypothetical protein
MPIAAQKGSPTLLPYAPLRNPAFRQAIEVRRSSREQWTIAGDTSKQGTLPDGKAPST